jgi:hypothetical protein
LVEGEIADVREHGAAGCEQIVGVGRRKPPEFGAASW